MFWIELIIVLAIIFIGVRVGGTFLAMAGGIGMFIMTFILHVTPSDPPITVILIMIAVICAAATMQACGGLDYLVRIAEKILRKNPKMITVLAPVVAYIFLFQRDRSERQERGKKLSITTADLWEARQEQI